MVIDFRAIHRAREARLDAEQKAQESRDNAAFALKVAKHTDACIAANDRSPTELCICRSR